MKARKATLPELTEADLEFLATPWVYPKTGSEITEPTASFERWLIALHHQPPDGESLDYLKEIETLANPVKRAAYDLALGITSQNLARRLRSPSNKWSEWLRWGCGSHAVAAVLVGQNWERCFGYFFAPNFEERRILILGEFEVERNDRVIAVKPYHWGREFHSTSVSWQTAFDAPALAFALPLAIVFAVSARYGSEWYDKVACAAIASARANGRHDKMPRLCFTLLAAGLIIGLTALLFVFGPGRVVVPR